MAEVVPSPDEANRALSTPSLEAVLRALAILDAMDIPDGPYSVALRRGEAATLGVTPAVIAEALEKGSAMWNGFTLYILD
jgi:hypothetical protein